MVSEWMENGDLKSYLRRNPDADRNRLCMDVCEGLCYIHTNGMVHGDLKAANVMISSGGRALIADFGNAQLKDLTLKFTSAANGGLSIRWTAPELLLKDGGPHVSKEADVYAYGMVMLEVMTGNMPFEGASEPRVICLVAYERKVPPRPDVDMRDGLWDVMNLCWTREASERPEIASVKHYLQGLFATPIPPRISQPSGLQFEGPPLWPQLAEGGAKATQLLRSTSSRRGTPRTLLYRRTRTYDPIRLIRFITPQLYQISGPSFGVPLERLLRDGTGQSRILSNRARAIEKHGLHISGIYRLGESTPRVREVKGLLDWDLDAVHLDSSEWVTDIITVASVLKLWFDELPGPLIVWKRDNSLIEVAQIEGERLRSIRAHEHVKAPPDTNYLTLEYPMGHLYLASEYRYLNQMSRSNLAIVFGPVLWRAQHESERPGAAQDNSWQYKASRWSWTSMWRSLLSR